MALNNDLRNERSAFYDNAKFLLITAVVLSHFAKLGVYRSSSFQPLLTFFNTFYMPTFFFIAGLFHSNKNVCSRTTKFVLIAFTLKILFALQTMLFYGYCDFQLLEDSNMPWFLFALAAYTLISYITSGMNKVFFLSFCVILACFVGYDPAVGNFLYISRIVIFYPFYVLGEILDSAAVVNKYRTWRVRIVGILIVLSCLVLCIIKNDTIYPYVNLMRGNVSYSTISAIETIYGGCSVLGSIYPQ